jgi:outer membrane assembly lipoprotein YfiO
MSDRRLWLWAAAPVLAMACATARPPADLSPPDRFAWAQTKFDEGDFAAAVLGFQDFIIRAPLDPLVDSAQFMLGESYLRDGRELLAAGEFERLATTRPNSAFADDAQLGACRAYWELSPKLSLEQEHTRQAIDQCSRLLQFFPDSPLRAEAESLIAQASTKLAAKSYQIARYYVSRRLYESANIYLEKALAEAPRDSELVPEILMTLYESYRRVGFDSEARGVRDRLLREYADSEQAARLREESGGSSNG